MPGPEAIAVLALALLAFYLYMRPGLRTEFVSLTLLLALVMLFYLFPISGAHGRIDDATMLSGFGQPVLIAIVCLMIMARGLMMTGALEPAVRWLTRVWKWSPTLGLLLTLLFGLSASAFLNDTPVLVVTLPMLLGVAERTGTSASKTLMPVNCAILGGGMLTAVGTSTNLLVLSIAADLGTKPMGIFGFTSIACGALLIALPYLWLVAPRLLPEGTPRPNVTARVYGAAVRLRPGNALVGRTMEQAGRAYGRSLPVIALWRGPVAVSLGPSTSFTVDDELLLADTSLGLRDFATAFGLELSSPEGAGRFVDRSHNLTLAELIIGAKSPQRGKSLSETRFAEQFGVVVIGLHRSDEDLVRPTTAIGDTLLRSGDLLLVQGSESRINELRGSWDLMVLDSRMDLPHTSLAPWALAIMAAVIALTATQLLPIHIAALFGVLAMLWKGCVRFEGAGRGLSLQVILLIVASIALGLSLVDSGAAQWLASGIVLAVSGLHPSVQLAAMMTLSALLTNFVSNSASAAVGTPIAVTVAHQLALPPEPFVLAILFGANLSYATPMACQTNLLIMNAAGYSFRDFLRVGLPLVLVMLVTLSYLLVRSYGLR